MGEFEIGRRSFLALGPSVAGAAVAARALAANDTTTPIASAAFPTGRTFPIEAKPFWEVQIDDAFWSPKIATNAQVTIPFELSKSAAPDAYLANGILESAIFTQQTAPRPENAKAVAERISRLLKPRPKVRNNYFEIAASQYRATRDRRLLDHAVTDAATLAAEFKAKDPPFSGGERDALNCVQLYRVTGDPAHLALAKHYLDIRGRADSVGRSRHNQSYMPTVDQREAIGHAVNCVTLALSLVDVGVLTGDRRYFDAGQAIWSDAVARKFYVTGGVGATGNEGFGEPYVLPTISAYSETCAVLMFQTLSHRLFLATGDARYIDVMERGMYNNALSGVSHAGKNFFYVNRLASAGDGRDTRWQHAALECCPPNLVRFLASMPGLIYAQGKDGAVHVNLYVGSSARFGALAIKQETSLPWAGDARVTVTEAPGKKAILRLRIPGWARGEVAPGGLYATTSRPTGVRITLNGAGVPAGPDALGYVTLDRVWHAGDTIVLAFPMESQRVTADPRVHAAARRVAIERGPIVYCAEWPEAPDGKALDLVVAPGAPLNAGFDPKLFGGVGVIDTVARRAGHGQETAKPLRLIPYHLWANRGAGEMTTWLLTGDYKPGDVGPAGGLIFYVNPDAARDGWRYLEATPFDLSGGAQWGRFRKPLKGAAATAIGSGAKNTADMLSGGVEPGTAAQLCAAFKLNGVGGWFLPSTDELVEMYRALKANGVGDFRDAGMADNCQYWASSQHDEDMAAHVDFADNGRLHGDDKDFPRRVRAVRMI